MTLIETRNLRQENRISIEEMCLLLLESDEQSSYSHEILGNAKKETKPEF